MKYQSYSAQSMIGTMGGSGVRKVTACVCAVLVLCVFHVVAQTASIQESWVHNYLVLDLPSTTQQNARVACRNVGAHLPTLAQHTARVAAPQWHFMRQRIAGDATIWLGAVYNTSNLTYSWGNSNANVTLTTAQEYPFQQHFENEEMELSACNDTLCPLYMDSLGYWRVHSTSSGTDVSRHVLCEFETCDYRIEFRDVTTDHACKSIAPACNPTTSYEAVHPTATSDRVCAQLTTCTHLEYEVIAPGATSDRECARLTRCTGKQIEVAAATSTSDRMCVPKLQCPTGTYFDQSAHPNQVQPYSLFDCSPWTVCQRMQAESVPGTATSDRQCTDLVTAGCDIMFHYRMGKSCLLSPPMFSGGVYESPAWQPGDEARSGVSSTACDESQYYEAFPSTPMNNRVCAMLSPPCEAGTYQTKAPSAFADRQCAPVTICEHLGMYEAVSASPTSDSICKPYSQMPEVVFSTQQVQVFPNTPVVSESHNVEVVVVSNSNYSTNTLEMSVSNAPSDLVSYNFEVINARFVHDLRLLRSTSSQSEFQNVFSLQLQGLAAIWNMTALGNSSVMIDIQTRRLNSMFEGLLSSTYDGDKRRVRALSALVLVSEASPLGQQPVTECVTPHGTVFGVCRQYVHVVVVLDEFLHGIQAHVTASASLTSTVAALNGKQLLDLPSLSASGVLTWSYTNATTWLNATNPPCNIVNSTVGLGSCTLFQGSLYPRLYSLSTVPTLYQNVHATYETLFPISKPTTQYVEAQAAIITVDRFGDTLQLVPDTLPMPTLRMREPWKYGVSIKCATENGTWLGIAAQKGQELYLDVDLSYIASVAPSNQSSLIWNDAMLVVRVTDWNGNHVATANSGNYLVQLEASGLGLKAKASVSLSVKSVVISAIYLDIIPMSHIQQNGSFLFPSSVVDYAPTEQGLGVVSIQSKIDLPDTSLLSAASASALKQQLMSSPLIVSDKQPPVISNCPPYAIGVSPDPTAQSAPVYWTPPMAVDNVGLANFTSNFAPGNTFAIHKCPYTVVYTAIDTSGLSSQCTFPVWIEIAAIAENLVFPVKIGEIAPRFLGKRNTPTVRTTTFTDEWSTARSLVKYIPFRFDPQTVNAINIVCVPMQSTRFVLDVVTTQLRSRLTTDIVFRRVEPATGQTVSVDMEAPQLYEDQRVNIATYAMDVILSNGIASPLPIWWLQNKRCAVVWNADGVTLDAFRVSGVSLPFTIGGSMTKLVFQLRFPGLTTLQPSANHTYKVDDGSFVRVEYLSNTYTSSPSLSLENSTGRFFFLDETPPVFTSAPANITVRVSELFTQNTITTDDGSTVTLINATFVNVTWLDPVVDDNLATKSLTATHESGFVVGISSMETVGVRVMYTAEDRGENTATHEFYIRVIDDVSPQLICPRVIDIVAPNGTDQSTVPDESWEAIQVNDGVMTLNRTHLEPQALLRKSYPIGVSLASLSVEDGWGNTNSCIILVQVHDHEAPNITACVDEVHAISPDGHPTTASWSAISGVDNSGGNLTWLLKYAKVDNLTSTGAQDQANVLQWTTANEFSTSSALLPVGLYHMSMIAKDPTGNKATCDFTLSIANGMSASAIARRVGPLVAGGVIVLFLLVLIAYLLLRQQKSAKPKSFQEILQELEQLEAFMVGADGIQRPKELRRNTIFLAEVLGQGFFGEVRKAVLRKPGQPEMIVAVKTSHSNPTSESVNAIMKEAAVMAQFQHRNVIGLVGVVTVGQPTMAVLEYCERGSLVQVLQKRKRASEKFRLACALEVAQGLRYLASKRFLHRDVSARNVLVSTDGTCKLADFGLSRETVEKDYYISTGGDLPVRWTAIEALETNKFSLASDVWSFGVLLYEIWTNGATPYDGWSNHRVWVEVEAGYRLPQPISCSDEIYALMYSMWERDPAARPKITEVHTRLETVLLMQT
eukprot:m.87306 g.87306  ORF g.87306 m.87306 type:complete len:1906 (-) comp12825_c0_seq22:1084-6801(-)